MHFKALFKCRLSRRSFLFIPLVVATVVTLWRLHTVFIGYGTHHENFVSTIIHLNDSTLYRQVPCPSVLTREIEAALGYNEEVAKLLLPPNRIEKWEFKESSLMSYHEKQAKLMLKNFKKEGFTNRDEQLINQKVCVESNDEPVLVQYINKTLYAGWTGKIYGDLKRWDFLLVRRRQALDVIHEALKNHSDVPDFEIFVCVGDWGTLHHDTLALALTFTHEGGTLPLSEMESDFKSFDAWEEQRNNLMKAREKYPWNERKKQAVFRGGFRTCYPQFGDEAANPGNDEIKSLTVNGKLQCGRAALNHVAGNCYQSLFDVNVHSANPIPLEDQEQFKLIIYAEGHNGWANRLKLLLHMQTVTIMQLNKGGLEWYTLGLQPWVHYIPVDHLFLSLPAVTAWALQHDEHMLNISRNANEYAKIILSSESMKIRIYCMLREFAKLVKYKIVRDPDAGSWEDFLKVDYAIRRVKDWHHGYQ